MSGPLRLFLLVALLLGQLFTALPAEAQRNPFGAPPSSGSQTIAPERPAAGQPSVLTRFWVWVQTTQRDLYRQLAGALKRLKAGEGFAAAWLLAGLSFFYGVVHAAGPGHGKAVISSYVLANEKTARRGVVLCFLAALVQALSAIALVTILAVLLNAVGVRITRAASYLETASYALVAAVGAWLLISQTRKLLRRRRTHAHSHDHAHAHDHDHAHGHDHDHDHGDHCGHAHMPDAQQIEQADNWKSAAAIVLAVGIRPCTGAILVLVFALANGLFLAGVGATFAMALGTAITVSVLAVLAVGSRELAVKLAGPESVWADRVMTLAGFAGGALVLLLGVILFAGSLGPAPPF